MSKKRLLVFLLIIESLLIVALVSFVVHYKKHSTKNSTYAICQQYAFNEQSDKGKILDNTPIDELAENTTDSDTCQHYLATMKEFYGTCELTDSEIIDIYENIKRGELAKEVKDESVNEEWAGTMEDKIFTSYNEWDDIVGSGTGVVIVNGKKYKTSAPERNFTIRSVDCYSSKCLLNVVYDHGINADDGSRSVQSWLFHTFNTDSFRSSPVDSRINSQDWIIVP